MGHQKTKFKNGNAVLFVASLKLKPELTTTSLATFPIFLFFFPFCLLDGTSQSKPQRATIKKKKGIGGTAGIWKSRCCV